MRNQVPSRCGLLAALQPARARRSQFIWLGVAAGLVSSQTCLAQRVWYEISDVGTPNVVLFEQSLLGNGRVNSAGDCVGAVQPLLQWIPTSAICFISRRDDPHGYLSLPNRFPLGMAGVGINDARHIAGDGYRRDPQFPERRSSRAWFFDGNKVIEVTKSFPDHESYALDLNNADQVVGLIDGTAYVWSAIRGMAFLPQLGGGCCSAAERISDAGWIAGYSADSVGQQPVVWVDSRLHALPKPEGHTRGHAYSIADAEGEFGVAAFVGGQTLIGQSDPTFHPALWRVVRDSEGRVSMTYETLPSIPGEDEGVISVVNCHGDAAGWSGDARGAGGHVVWKAGEVHRLRDVMSRDRWWSTMIFRDMNSHGQIWGMGFPPYREDRPFVLTPARLELDIPVPGIPGRENTIRVEQVPPGAEVRLYWTLSVDDLSLVTLSPECGSMGLSLSNPIFGGSAIADETGTARVRVFVPHAARGRTIMYQVGCVSDCSVSNRVEWGF